MPERFGDAVVAAEGQKQVAFTQARQKFEAAGVAEQPKRQAEYDLSLRSAERIYLQAVIDAAVVFGEINIANWYRERLSHLRL